MNEIPNRIGGRIYYAVTLEEISLAGMYCWVGLFCVIVFVSRAKRQEVVLVFTLQFYNQLRQTI